MGWEPIPKLIHTSFPDQGLTSHVPISHLLPFADSGFQVRLFFKGSSFCMRLFKNIHIGLPPLPYPIFKHLQKNVVNNVEEKNPRFL